MSLLAGGDGGRLLVDGVEGRDRDLPPFGVDERTATVGLKREEDVV
jgi:hypothetical protein